MNMNYKEFAELSKRTAPFAANPQNLQEFNNLLANYSSGIVGEWFEYQVELSKCTHPVSKEQIEAAFKECGDIAHYGVNLLNMLQEEFDDSKLSEPTLQDIEIALRDILETQKKYIYHGHTFEKQLFIDSVYTVLSYIKNAYSGNLGYILNKNIKKLKLRYPEKFTAADSIARVDTK